MRAGLGSYLSDRQDSLTPLQKMNFSYSFKRGQYFFYLICKKRNNENKAQINNKGGTIRKVKPSFCSKSLTKQTGCFIGAKNKTLVISYVSQLNKKNLNLATSI